jgi:hypothetical protein
VNLIDHKKGSFVFEMSGQEKALLLAVLKLFPLSPLAHPRRQLSADPEAHVVQENQHLLAEALNEQQAHHRRWIAKWQESGRFEPGEAGFQLRLTRAEMEELLQVLNDVRVGSWMALGSPEMEDVDELLAKDENMVHWHRLKLADVFQMFFLNAIRRAEN